MSARWYRFSLSGCSPRSRFRRPGWSCTTGVDASRAWQRGLLINGVGAVATLLVTTVVVVSKFTEGAWISAVAIPVLVLIFKGINRHYQVVDRALSVEPGIEIPEIQHTVVVLVGPKVHLGVIQAIAYTKSLRPDFLHAVSVSYDPEQAAQLRAQWERFDIDVPLDVLESQYREITRPVLDYVEELDKRWSSDVVTVVIPELVVRRWWQQLLHNQTALWLKARLLFREGTVVTSVPAHVLESGSTRTPVPTRAGADAKPARAPGPPSG